MEYIEMTLIACSYLGTIYFLNKRIDIVNKRCDQIELVLITFLEPLIVKNMMEKKNV